ncbi:MAG: hypothetical protein KDK07_25590 [Bauldia sp.]|nr:hypothetical protein [Bauldia sp.]
MLKDHQDRLLYTVAEVAEANSMPVATLRSRFQRRQFVVAPEVDADPAGIGLPRLLSRESAIAVAIAEALTTRGVSIADATKAAVRFAYAGDADRDPGRLYAKGETVLAVGAQMSRVFNISKSTKFSEIFKSSIFGTGQVPCIVFLVLDELVESVDVRLEQIARRRPVDQRTRGPAGDSEDSRHMVSEESR